jgi:site-specific recombinase XerD
VLDRSASGFPTVMTRQRRRGRRAHIEALLIHLFDDGKSAATLNNRSRSLHRFFTFVVEEGDVDRHPTERMTPSQVPDWHQLRHTFARTWLAH